MKCKLEKTENANEVKLELTVEAQKFSDAIQKVYFQSAKYFNIPGFRKGKAPMNIVEKYYGKEIFYEDAFNEVVPDELEEALKENNIEVVSKADIDVKQIEKGKDLIFTAVFQTKPEAELGKYKGIEIPKIEYTVSDEDINHELGHMQEHNSRLISIEDRPVEKGDIAVIDFEGFVDGVAFEGGKAEGHELEIGSNTFIPGFEDQIIGMKIDEERDINVKFPEEYFSKDLAGKDATFKVKVHEIKKKELPELDDEFAKDVSEFDTLEEYKKDIAQKLKERKEDVAKREKEDKVVDAIIENAQMDIPEAMIQNQIRQLVDDFVRRLQSQGLSIDQYYQFTGLDNAKIQEQMRPQALKRIQSRLVLEKVAEVENIQVTDEKVDEEIAKMAEMYKMEADKLKELMGDYEKEQMKKDIAVQEAVTLVVDAAKVTEVVEKTEE